MWRDNGAHGGQPLFARNQVEAQLDGMLMPTVQLRSGGYLVINQAEALVAIDVNSGRSTRERNIEETALRTNLEAADEVARQLRLRDLAGLIVIDFIDMESKRHNAMVERRIKEALKNDRARIQVGHISHFGLLEMSRQRLRPSLAETSFIPCPHCGGTGHVRSTENAAIHVLRGIEDEGSKHRSAEIVVHVSTPVALYLLNHKRERIREIEIRYAMRVIIAADDAQIAPQFRIEKVRVRSPDEMPTVVTSERSMPPPPVVEPEDEEEEAEAVGAEDDDDGEEDTPEQAAADAAGGGGDEAERRRKRRRRRRRGGRRDEPQTGSGHDAIGEPVAGSSDGSAVGSFAEPAGEPSGGPGTLPVGEPAENSEAAPVEAEPVAAIKETENRDAGSAEPTEAGETTQESDDDPRNKRRGRRGGRRRRRENEGELSPFAVPGADQPDLQPVYAGPTPADPFGGRAFDIFDVMDQAERAAEAQPAARSPSAAEIVNNSGPEPEVTSDAAPSEIVSAGEVVEEAIVAFVDAGPSATIHNEPEAPVAAQTEQEIVNSAAPEPESETLQPHAEAAASQPVEDAPAEIDKPEPSRSEPLVKPILIGADGEPLAEKKRGWWRR